MSDTVMNIFVLIWKYKVLPEALNLKWPKAKCLKIDKQMSCKVMNVAKPL